MGGREREERRKGEVLHRNQRDLIYGLMPCNSSYHIERGPGTKVRGKQ
jgi:hypothetical protein